MSMYDCTRCGGAVGVFCVCNPTDSAEQAKATSEVKSLRALAAACYAGLGAECNLPERWLDVLSAAANGEPFDTEDLLPFEFEARSPATVAQPVDMAQRWDAVIQLAHDLDDAAQHITERQAYDFATRFRVLAGVEGDEAADQAAQPCHSQGCEGEGNEEVHIEAVAKIVKRRHGLEWELEVDWLAEGTVLLIADAALTDDDGSGIVYRAALSTTKSEGA